MKLKELKKINRVDKGQGRRRKKEWRSSSERGCMRAFGGNGAEA